MALEEGLTEQRVQLPGGPELAVRRTPPDLAHRPFLLVHGLASNARLWDGVAAALADAGREVAAVDLRGHGQSGDGPQAHSSELAAADLAALCGELDWTGARAPVVAGQSWGGNVVMTLAARHGGVAAVACVDGGWLHFGDRFADFDACWAVLAPPAFDGVRLTQVRAYIARAHADWPPEAIEATLANLVVLPEGDVRNRLDREHHQEILRSMWEQDPRELYPLVHVPVLLMPAAGESETRRAAAVREALALLPDAEVSWYAGGDHDLHAQQPQRVAADLLALDARVDGGDR